MIPNEIIVVNGKLMAFLPGNTAAITHVSQSNRWSRQEILAWNESYYSGWVRRVWDKLGDDACNQKNQSVAALAQLLFRLGIVPGRNR